MGPKMLPACKEQGKGVWEGDDLTQKIRLTDFDCNGETEIQKSLSIFARGSKWQNQNLYCGLSSKSVLCALIYKA